MSAAALAALAVVAAGFAVRPTPPHRDEATAPRAAPARPWPGAPRLGQRPAVPGPDDVARWCTDLARATRVGVSLTAAIRDTAPPAAAADAVAELALALDRGAGLASALAQTAERCADHPDLQLALTVLRACAEHGGPPAEPIDRAAATLRARAADLADRRTHSAQAQLSARVMTLLPVAMLAVLLITSAAVRAVLVQPVGVLVVAAGAALNVAGSRWMRRIIGGRP